MPLPQDETTLRTMFLDTFETLTGTALLTAPDHIPVAALRRKNGGMSNGMVARSYWEGQMLPALIVRYHAANRA